MEARGVNVGTLTIEATPGVQALFPDAPVIDGRLHLEHTPRTTIPLRAIGYDVPPSIRTNYDFCGGTPFEIQTKTCELITENPRCYVLNSMGTGKTRAALWSFDYMKKLGLVNKLLVVCPLSTMNFTWAAEVLRATPHLRWAVLYGTAAKRRKLLDSRDVDVYVVNHDGLGIIAKEIVQRADIDVICLDELAVYRNNTLRTKTAAKVCANKPVVFGMTGAPMPNYVTDIYNQIKVITPHRVPKHFSWLRDELQVRITNFKWLNKPGAIEKAFNYFQPSVRYTLDDIMELPEAVIPPPMETALSPEQKRVYTSLRKFATAAVASKEINAMNAGVLMSKLLQVSTGWLYDSKHTAHSLGGEARLQALVDIIDAAAGKTIIFANYLHALHGIDEFLTARGYTPHVIYGAVSHKDRTKMFDMFQNTEDRSPLLVFPRCISHGLTLTAADTVVWFGPPLSAETYDQCNARIRRVGQKRKQLFVHLCSTQIERQVYNLLTNRLMQQDSFLHLLEDASWD